MGAIEQLLQLQAGKEGPWGTPVAATAKLMGIQKASIKPIVVAERLQEMRGSMAQHYNQVLTEQAGEGKVEGYVLYEDICYWFDAVFGEATPSGAGPYTYTYGAPLTSVPSPRKQTLILGDGTNIYKLAGALPKNITISGENGKPLMYSCDLLGKSVSTGSLAALTDRTINPVMGSQLTLFSDAWGGTIGTTGLTATAWAFELKIDTGRETDPMLGSILPQDWHEGIWEGELNLKMQFNTASKARVDAIIGALAVEQRQIRIKASNGANLDLALDFAGGVEEAPELFTNRNGVLQADITYKKVYNTALGNWFEATVINGVNALV